MDTLRNLRLTLHPTIDRMISVCVLTVLLIATSMSSVRAQSEFLQYRESGFGLSMSYAELDPGHGYGLSAGLSYRGLSDVSAAAIWTSIDSLPSAPAGYAFAITLHPLKRYKTSVQGFLAISYAMSRQAARWPESEKWHVTPVAGLGFYLTADSTRKISLLPMVSFSRTLAERQQNFALLSAVLTFKLSGGVIYIGPGLTLGEELTSIQASVGFVSLYKKKDRNNEESSF